MEPPQLAADGLLASRAVECRAGTGRRPHAPRERLRLHGYSVGAAPSGAALKKPV